MVIPVNKKKMKYKALTIFLFAAFPAFAQKPVQPDSNLVKGFFFDGIRYKINENYIKAVESFNKVVSLDPRQADAYYEIASLDYRQNKLQESEFALKKAMDLNSNNIWYWKLCAELYKRKGDMPGLVQVLERLIVMEPDVEAYYFDRCNALAISGNVPGALKAYDELEKKFGVSVESSRGRKRLSQEKKPKTAEHEAGEVIADHPEDIKSYLYASNLLQKDGKKSEALDMLKKAKALDPSSLEVDLAMVDYYVAEGQIPLAGGVLRDLVAAHQDDPRLFAMYGDLLYKQGDSKEALVQYLKSLQLSQQIYVVWEQVLNIYLSQKDFKKAIETGSAAVSVYPNQAVLYYYLAFAQHREDQYPAALENIATAEELATGEQELLASVEDVYALVLMNLAKFDLAEAKILKALQLNPVKKTLYLEHYGDILALKGNKEKALDLWKQARDLGSKSEKLKQKINENRYFK